MKIFLFILFSFFILLLLILLSPAKIYFEMAGENIKLSVALGIIKIRILPQKPKKKSKKTPKKRKKTADLEQKTMQNDAKSVQNSANNAQKQCKNVSNTVENAESKAETKPKKSKFAIPKISFELICEYLNLASDALKSFKKLLVINKLKFHTKIGTDDVAKTAMAYGSACAAVNLLYPVLKENLNLKKTDIYVEPAFDKTSTEIEFEIIVSMIVIGIIIAGIKLLIKFLRINKNKAVSENE